MYNSTTITLEGYRNRIHDFSPDGEARHTVLALHGFGTTGGSFRHAAPYLSQNAVRLVAPDQLGFGGSDKPSGVYSLDLYTKLTLAAADRLALDRPYLLGHSAGGKVAAATVARYPDRFAGLILVNTGGFSILAPILLLADTPLFRIVDRPFFRRRILGQFGIAQTVESPEQWEAFRRIRGNNRALDIDAAGYREAVRSIKLPVLLIWGLKDRMLPRGTPKRVLRDLPQTKFVPIPGSGHTPMRDDPEGFSGHVIEFVSNQSG
ncbi:MAG TPA: alpha/beta hydrolase [Rhodothermales bacterium]|nr:alpha/beta hydrolase [Rhodothermales bacterium]